MTHAQHADPRHLGVLQNGHITTQLIAAAVRTGIHDQLGDGLVADERLGELTGIGLPLLRRFLPALVGLGLVEEARPHHYRNTALGALLRRDTGSAYGHGLMAGGVYYEAWAGLDYSLRTGKSAFEHRLGESLWDRLASDISLPRPRADFGRVASYEGSPVADARNVYLGLTEVGAEI